MWLKEKFVKVEALQLSVGGNSIFACEYSTMLPGKSTYFSKMTSKQRTLGSAFDEGVTEASSGTERWTTSFTSNRKHKLEKMWACREKKKASQVTDTFM